MEPIKYVPLRPGRVEVWSNGVENMAVDLTYDLSAQLKVWPNAKPSVAFERADGEKYAHIWTLDGPVLHIPLLAADTAIEGMCKCMITLQQGESIDNTDVFYGTIMQGLDSLGEEPDDPHKGIIEQVNAAAKRAEEAAERAEQGQLIIKTDETLKLTEEGVLSVNTANDVMQNNTLPITSAAVYTTVGNIEVLLSTI